MKFNFFSKEHLGRWFSIFNKVILFFLTNLFSLLDVISCEQLSSAQSVFGVVNKSVTFLTASSTPIKDILWKKGKDKVVEKEENLDESVYPPFRERILLNIVTGDLTIFNLSSSDEDEYEFESTSIKDSIKFSLTVFGEYSINWFV